MTGEFEIRNIAILVYPKGKPIFDEKATRVEIVDEAGGEFVEVNQGGVSALRIDPCEWPTLRSAIDEMITACREDT